MNVIWNRAHGSIEASFTTGGYYCIFWVLSESTYLQQLTDGDVVQPGSVSDIGGQIRTGFLQAAKAQEMSR